MQELLNEPTLFQGLLVALFAGIAGIDMFNGITHIHRPIVGATVVGLILGDLQTGLLVGGTLELAFMGMVPLGGAQPPNMVAGGIIGAAFAIITNVEPHMAVGIAMPFAIAVQSCITLLFTVFSPVMHKCDEMVARGDWRGIEKVNYLGLTVLFTFYSLITFLPIYLGAAPAQRMVEAAPQWLMNGLGVAGGMMPAIGFALLMKIMLKKAYVPYLALGFLGVTYLGLPIMAVGMIALAVALLEFYKSETAASAMTPATAGGMMEDEEDGI
ncbi:MAG: PTS N-acetylgalactosamine transporter subunit IIC [Endozoicomonas sp.]